MKNKKTIMIGILCTLVCVMAIGYAFLAQELNINGRASIDSTWKVEITNITERDIVGDASSKEAPSYTSTTANFSVGLIQPGDSITYDIEISNLGTLKAKVDSINVTMDNNDAITYTTSGLKNGDKLGVGEKTTLTVKVEYNLEVTSQPTNTGKDIEVTINYIQDIGTGNDQVITYDTYAVGDVVNFAGSNWYVISNSSSEEDYVTLMKEKVLTSSALGDYAYNYTCSESDASSGMSGCKTTGQVISHDTMQYYWDDACHPSGYYGYTEGDSSGCEGHNDYEGSKVKEYLEGTYINTLGETNLKEVDGYKIRLITVEELQNNLAYATELTKSFYEYNSESTPNWVYENFYDETSVSGYWTMVPDIDSPLTVWSIRVSGILTPCSLTDGASSVRPVINLLKSSI